MNSFSLGMIGFVTFMLGILLSIPGIFIFMCSLPANTKCATGAFGIPPLEIMILLFTTPSIYYIYKHKLARNPGSDTMMP
ncbi:hypothetical protein FHS10_001413 [Mucilaginibacter dorajii]|nr:hypothetical protein [Mucilaginibacter dorajii]